MVIESFETTCMRKDNTLVPGKNKALFEKWKLSKQERLNYVMIHMQLLMHKED